MAEAVKDFGRLEAEVTAMGSRLPSESQTAQDEEIGDAQLWRAIAKIVTRSACLNAGRRQLPVVAPERIAHWVSYRQPHTLDYGHLVQIERPRAEVPELMIGPEEKLRRRDGFKTD